MACSNAEHVVLGKLACSKQELVQEHSKVLVLELHSMELVQELARNKVLELEQVHSMEPVLVLEHSKGLVLEPEHNKVPEQVHSKELVLARNMEQVLVLGSKVLEPACSNESVSGGSNALA